MSTSADPRDSRTSVEDLAATAPAELAGEIRTATARVYACAQTWRSSPSWRGDKLDRKAYESIVAAAAEVDATPEVHTYRDVDHLVDVVARILNGWWPDSPGVRRDLHDAVEQLRHAAMQRTAWVRQARSMLGQQW